MRRLIFGLLALIAGFVFLDSARDASALDQAIKDRGVMVLSEPVEKYLTDRRRSRKSYSLPIVIKTHVAKERDVQTALREINQKAFVSEPTTLIRIEGKDE